MPPSSTDVSEGRAARSRRPRGGRGRSAGRLARDVVRQARPAAVAVGPEQPHRLAVLDLVEDDLVAAHPLEPPPRRRGRLDRRRGGRTAIPTRRRPARCRKPGSPTAASGRSRQGRALVDRADRSRAGPARGSSGRPPRPGGPCVRGRMTSARQPHRGQSTATTRSRSRARVSGPSSSSWAAAKSSATVRRGPAAARSARDRSRGSGSRRGTGAAWCRTGSPRR